MDRSLRTGVAGAVLLAALAGCAGDDGGPTALPPASAPATSAPPSTTPPAASSADQVRTAYLRYWDAVIAAHRAADPRSAGLGKVATDPQLSKVRLTVERNRLQRISLRGQVTHDISAPRVSGTTATLQDCYDISGWDPVDVRTGAAIDVTEEGGTGRYRARYTLRRSGTSWLVTTESRLGGC